MEEHLNPEELRLFELLETTDYELLSAEDKLFADQQLTVQEYRLQRRMMLEAEELYPVAEEPRVLERKMPGNVFQKTIPLYQALLAVAAVIVLFICLRSPGISGNPQPVAKKTTEKMPVLVAQKNAVHDTIVRTVTKLKTVERFITDTVDRFIMVNRPAEEPRLLQAVNSPVLPEMNPEQLRTKGFSVREDNTSGLIPLMVGLRD